MLIEATTQTTTGHVYILSGNDDLNVALGVTIRSIDTDAVTSWEGQHTVTVAGTVIGEDDGLNFIGAIAAQTVTIAATGVITSGGDGVITDADGVILDGVNSVMTNAGLITSYGSAASLFVRDGGTTTLSNSGTMIGRVAGVWNKFGAGTLNFTNTGTVESPNNSYLGGDHVDLVTNAGQMRGTVDLGGGDDRYDGLTGTVAGQILGGLGDDVFVMGAASDTVNGGDGFDTLDFSHATTALTVNLTTNSLNRGLAYKDVYTGIEQIIGGMAGDRLTGDAADNLLQGMGGSDRLVGGAGNDTLVGGALRDNLTGGTGSDNFVFSALSDKGDTIVDFAQADDFIILEGAEFGYGSYQGNVDVADLVISAVAKALDPTDHFIFRTTDKTLWFDADGNGAIKAVMIANLNDDAMLDVSNLLIV